jgi:hypothetical protein
MGRAQLLLLDSNDPLNQPAELGVTMVLLLGGAIPRFDAPLWVILLCAAAIWGRTKSTC